MNDNTKYVLHTTEGGYFVEYLLNYLVISNSITEAMVFEDLIIAKRFKQMLFETCQLKTIISTYID